MIGGEAVGLHEDLVVDVGVFEGDVVAEFVAEGGGAGGDLHADDVGTAFGEIGVDLRLREVAVGSVVTRGELGGDLALTEGLEFVRVFEGAVGGAVGEEDFGVFAVDFGSLGLAIGAVGTADVGAFVPGEADPFEGVEDHLFGGGDEAGAVGVFDAEDELASALAGVDVVDEADVGGADVGVSGRRRGDADANGRGDGGDFRGRCHGR